MKVPPDAEAAHRLAQATLGALCVLVLALAARVDLPRVSEGGFWGDGATYHGMAWSLVEDHDFTYEARDIARIRREFASGPQGLFLKQCSGGLTLDRDRGFPYLRRVPPEEPRLYFAKSMVYPVFLAPFVRALGTRGILVANALCLGLAVLLAYRLLLRQSHPYAAAAAAVALFGASIAPLYVAWPQPEVFNVAVITGALAAWASGRPLLSAVLFGIAAYSKPTNVLLAFPLGVEPLLAPRGEWLRGLGRAVARGLVVAGVTLLGFGANAVVTGEMNYQGGERKTFLGPVYPLETSTVTFEQAGTWMSTEKLGPRVEGVDDGPSVHGAAEPIAAEELRRAFRANLAYFWVGRYGGAVPYFFPVVVALLLFLLRGPRDRAGWLAVAALAVSWLAYIVVIPDNWYGGGGTVGNRYFLNLVPLAVFFVPRGTEWAVAGLGLLGGWTFLAPALLDPYAYSRRPARLALHAPFRVLPVELTMLNDLSFATEPWRKKKAFGDPEGNPRTGRKADPAGYWLYFPDDGTRGREHDGAEAGFRLVPGARADIVLRALEPVQRVDVHVRGLPAGDTVEVTAGGARTEIAGGEGERTGSLEPPPGLLYYDSLVSVLRFRSRAPSGASPFVWMTLAVEPRRR